MHFFGRLREALSGAALRSRMRRFRFYAVDADVAAWAGRGRHFGMQRITFKPRPPDQV
jgi:hypothetical protein